ncbi:MAG: YggS family pyridoxal phosphate-dependent enzyme [Firmicutes bacterium]|jgi:pyridoxal phosphate enzyme (YggS family)|nr:YggS family pyridoxal phosphate-dependent enzyme [Bacillota bacterium]
MLKNNLALIRERINKAVSRRNTAPENITLVAVTKTVPPRVINEALELGINNFGENRVQDALPKIECLPAEINWHFIGHLQTNKVRQVLPVFKLIHSLDSIKLAGAIQKEAEKKNMVANVLLQVNIGEEKSKYGFRWEEVQDALVELTQLNHIKVLGLMGIAPFVEDPEEVRPYFRRLYSLFKAINLPGVEMKYLSMGMSNDFEVALEEGANVIRVGTSLFGSRS